MKPPSVTKAAVRVLQRAVYPSQSWELLRHLGTPKPSGKAADDPQLQLYSELLPGDFLHYGFFDDVTLSPDRISIRDLQLAQTRYADEILRHVQDAAAPVLDAGCGMGGLVGRMLQAGFQPMALTPNHAQIDYVRKKYPSVPYFQGKFEALPAVKFASVFGTVLMAESFQYMRIERTLPAISRILRPGGRWVICDYFRSTDQGRKPHLWSSFQNALKSTDLKIIFERDITLNVLPTIAYVHMLGERLAAPLVNFVIAKLRRKRPAIHHLLQDTIEELRAYMLEQLQIVDPERFRREKKYLLLVLQKG